MLWFGDDTGDRDRLPNEELARCVYLDDDDQCMVGAAVYGQYGVHSSDCLCCDAKELAGVAQVGMEW